MAKNSEVNPMENERDEVGMFLLNMFHEGYFGTNRMIEKCLLRNKFGEYIANKKFNQLWNCNKMDTLLKKYNFLYFGNKYTKFCEIDGKTFWDFRRKIIAKMDDEQIKKNFSTKIIISNEGNSKNIGNIEVDPESAVYDLKFKHRVEKANDPNIVVSSKGCFICQLNFSSETEYEGHIKSHVTASDYKELIAEKCEKFEMNNFDIKYRHCKNTYSLNFTILNIGEDIVIDKIVIIQSDYMTYLLEENVPVSLLKKSKVEFLVDCHLFEIGYEYPIFILSRTKNTNTLRFVEEHQFLRLEPFPLLMHVKLKSSRILPRGTLKFNRRIDSYIPSRKTEGFCKARSMSEELIKEHYPIMRYYLDNNKSLNASNMVGVFTLLLEMEDIAIRETCYCLNQYKRCINKCGSDYSVELINVHNHNIEDILREGDDVVLFGKKTKYYGIVNRICGKTIYFSLPRQCTSPSEQYTIVFKPNRLQIMAQREGLEVFREKPFLAKMLFPTVNIMKEPSKKRLSMFNTSVSTNQEQEEAVMNIVDSISENIPYVIFGPPGTGKTTTVVECILQIWKQSSNNRILVVTGSNAACDEVALRILNRILKLDPNGIHVLRLYAAAAAEKRAGSLDLNLIEASNICHGYHFYPPLETICSYRIIACTLSVSGKLYQGCISKNFFSHVFIDECAASTETEALIPISGMMSPKCKLIVSGDSKQLGPILKSKLANDLGLKTSLLERLLDMPCYQKDGQTAKYNKTILTRLVRNFRNHPDILKISNELYYDNELIPCADKDLTHWALGWHLLPQKNVPIIFHAVRGQTVSEASPSLCNYVEINIVMDYVKDLMFFGVNGRIIQECDIGIVTPYKKQYNLIRAQLDQRKWFNIESGSVEQFQGKEKPIIIISTVRSDTKTLGFLDNPKRLNVSLTRAQALLIIIGNPQTLSISDDWRYVVNYCIEKGVVCGAKSLTVTSGPIINNCDESSNSEISSLKSSVTNLSVDKKKRRRRRRSRRTSWTGNQRKQEK